MDVTRGRQLIKFMLTALLFLIGYFLYQYFLHHHDPAKILKDHAMTSGTLTRFGEGEEEGRTNLLYKTMYVYEVNGKTYERPFVGDNPCNYESDEKFKEMLNYNYPVIYYRPDPEYSRMLVRPEQFEAFEKEFPTAMNGIYQKYWNCQ